MLGVKEQEYITVLTWQLIESMYISDVVASYNTIVQSCFKPIWS